MERQVDDAASGSGRAWKRKMCRGRDGVDDDTASSDNQLPGPPLSANYKYNVVTVRIWIAQQLQLEP